MAKMISCVSALFFLLVYPFVAEAQYRSYKMELLIFAQYTDTDTDTDEVFDQAQSEIQWPDKILWLSQLNKASHSLEGIRKKLDADSRYRTLMHVAWTQSVGPNRKGRAVKIQNISDSVNGFFRIQRGSYLHLITDLEYKADGLKYYRLNEKRRIKLREIHYLDHPKFGVFARVTPF